VTPDERWAVSASWDKTLQVWDLATGLPIAAFHCDAGVRCCAATATVLIVAGDSGGQVHFLQLMERTPASREASGS
jgi:WD40 repeat protein